jgi:hypothetical protein
MVRADERRFFLHVVKLNRITLDCMPEADTQSDLLPRTQTAGACPSCQHIVAPLAMHRAGLSTRSNVNRHPRDKVESAPGVSRALATLLARSGAHAAGWRLCERAHSAHCDVHADGVPHHDDGQVMRRQAGVPQKGYLVGCLLLQAERRRARVPRWSGACGLPGDVSLKFSF